MDKTLKKRLLERLNEIEVRKLSGLHVVLLPDFFVDHFLYFDEFEGTIDTIKNIYSQGGGNLPGVKQRIHQGGNAANTALALARLGVKSHLICRTDRFGLHLLKYFLEKEGVDLSGVKSDGKLAITTAMEFGKKHANVMVGETGSVSDFSFNRLDDSDLERIANSDIVCVLNWNLNLDGTEFARDVFQFAKKHNVKTFFDSGDPSPRKKKISDLMSSVLTGQHLDIFGLNENELRHYANTDVNAKEEIVNAIVLLKKKIPARMDLHTAYFSCTIDKECTIVPTIPISKAYRATGAGDAWNAGNLFAELLGFQDDERLLFSNSYAAQYISSLEPIHATLHEAIQFLTKQ